ncbi:Acyl carrier protein [compost metagenome]
MMVLNAGINEEADDQEFEQFKAHLALKLKTDESLLRPEANWVKDVGITSIDMVKIVMLLRQKYDVKVSTTEAGRIRTVADAYHYAKQGVKA